MFTVILNLVDSELFLSYKSCRNSSVEVILESGFVVSMFSRPSDTQMVRHTALKLSRIDPCGIFYKTVRAFCDWFASLGSALVNFWPNLQAVAM